jgi:N-methylhydantoinase B/oxoprolinase/acetone carboxylase alpha subunit
LRTLAEILGLKHGVCVDCGLNTSRAAATSAVVGAIFNSLDKGIPRNAGSFRRLSFHYADNSVVASPVFPTAAPPRRRMSPSA